MKPLEKFKYPLLALGLFVVAMATGSFLRSHPGQNLADIISVTPANEAQEGILYINPAEVVMEVGDAYEFSAFTNSGTGQVPVESDWQAVRMNDQNQEEDAPDIGLPNCNGSDTCMVSAGNVTGEVTLRVNDGDQEATATVWIQPGEVEVSFEDEVPEWASLSIGLLQRRGIMKGYEDGRFAAADKVTRAQFITLLYRLMPYYQMQPEALLEGKDCNVHPDVPSDHFAYKPVCFAYYFGWEENLPLEGDKLLPDQNLLRKEAAQLLYNAIGQHVYEKMLERYDRTIEDTPPGYAASLFTDVQQTNRHADAIGVVAALDLMTGVEGERVRHFYGDRELNRAEAATLIWRTMSTIRWLRLFE